MNKAIHCALAAVLAVPMLACGGEPVWVEVTTFSDGSKFYADVMSVKQVEGKTLVWFLRSGPEWQYPLTTETDKHATAKSVLTLWSFDCSKGRFATELEWSFYAQANAQGDSIDSGTMPEEDVSFSYPIPGTYGDAVFDYVCTDLTQDASGNPPPGSRLVRPGKGAKQ